MASKSSTENCGSPLTVQNQEDMYSKLHNSILSFPNHETEWHAERLSISAANFESLADTITKWPNTFWGYGPFKNDANGWSIDYSKKNSKKISCDEENKILRKRVVELESQVAILQKRLADTKQERHKKQTSCMDGWNGGGVLH